MPEWYIATICRSTGKYDHGRYFIIPHNETWDLFSLNYKKVRCKVRRILNEQGKLVVTISEEVVLECKTIKTYTSEVPSLSATTWEVEIKALLFPPEFVKKYGFRFRYYIDLILIAVVSENSNQVDDEIFPKRIVKGNIALTTVSGIESRPRMMENLIEFSLKDEFYTNLIEEINTAYAYSLYRSTHILLRILFENLILQLLRIKFSNQKELYLSKNGKILRFSDLVDNVKTHKADFIPYGGQAFDEVFFSFIDNFRESSNLSTHILEVYLDKDKIEKDQGKMNFYIKLLSRITDEIKTVQMK